MTDEAYLRDIEEAARALSALPDDYAVLRALLRSLPPGTAPSLREAAAGLLSEQAGAGGLGDQLTLQSNQPIGGTPGGTLGIVAQLFYGKNNALTDPTFEAVSPINPIPLTYGVVGPNAAWNARYIVNSGTPPSDRRFVPDYTREDVTLRLNSDAPQVFLNGFAAGSTDILVRSTDTATRGAAPHLVGAIRAVDRNPQTLTNISSVTMWVELHDVSGNVLATSTPIDLVAFIAGNEDSVQLACSYAGATAACLVVRIRVVATGAGAVLQLSLGEPQLVRSSVQSPPPYAPIVGGWIPPLVSGRRDVITDDLVRSLLLPSDQFYRYLVEISGATHWGPGTATQDARLQRTGTKELSVDDTAGGPVRMKHVGPHFVQGPNDMDLAITYGADGPTNVARNDEGVPVSSSVISYAAGKVASVVTTRFGKTITVTPAYTGANITSVDRVVT